jgi:NAD(P)-dependent dehydrogenase (short-subunit alcohol dehydrogenase family)
LARGDLIIATGARPESLKELNEIHADATRSGQLVTIESDLLAGNAAALIAEECEQRGLYPDGLVNNARSLSFLRVDNTGMTNRADFVNELTLDVVAPYELTMALARMSKSRLATVVNIGSQYGVVAPNRALYEDFEQQSPIQYGVAKAALVHLTRELAVRLAPRHVRVNCISFGGVAGRANPAFEARYAQLAPAGGMLREADVPGPVAFLLSEASAGMTGHNLVVDGGWTIW